MNTEQFAGFKTFNDFLAWEYATNDTIDLKRIYCDVATGLNPGLLLSQIVYWRLPSKKGAPTKLTIKREGRLWLAKADAEWYAEVRLTKTEAMTARKILEALGLITCKTWKFGRNTCVHISLNEKVFLERLAAMVATPEEERDAGPLTRLKRPGPKKPGSKPTSGNRRKGDEVEVAEDMAEDAKPPAGDEGGPQNESEEQPRNYRFDNPGISESIIPGLSEGQFSNYDDNNSRIISAALPLSESPTQIPPESPAQIPTRKNIIIVTNTEVASELADDDDDLPEFGNETALIAEGSSTVVTDNGVTPLKGSVEAQPTGGQTVNATDTEKVPPAAAAPVKTVDNWAILALPAVDLDVLLNREMRDAAGNATLRRAMSCSDASRLDHMNDQLSMPLGTTSSGRLVTRDLYLRLTDQEIEAAILAARVDAKRGIQQFGALGYHALDATVGYPPSIEVLTKTRKSVSSPSAGAPGTALGAAYEVKRAGARGSAPEPSPTPQDEAPSPEYQQGAVWQHQANKTEVTVVKRDGPDVHVLGTTGIQVIRILDLMRLYRALPS